jgi:hypothetical protein
MFANQFLGSHDHCVVTFDIWPLTEDIAVNEETILPFDSSEIEGEVIGGRFVANELCIRDNEGNELECLTIISCRRKWEEVLAEELEFMEV